MKICMLGDSNVKKTELRRKYLGVDFSGEHLMTIGADFVTKKMKIEI